MAILKTEELEFDPQQGDQQTIASSDELGLSPARSRPYESEVLKASQRYGVDPELIHSVIKAESGYDKGVISPKGAMGVMQLMPGTASDLGVKNVFDPVQNIEGGTKYLGSLIQKYKNPIHAVAAYNMGPNAFDQFLQGKRKMPEETVMYVRNVLGKGFQGAYENEPGDLTGMTGASDVSRVSKDMLKVSRPLLEFGSWTAGAKAGAALGAASPVPGGALMGGLLGAGAGYALGSQGAGAMERSMGDATTIETDEMMNQALKDFIMGASTEGGMKVLGMVARPVADWVGIQANRLYESALKIPPSVPADIRNKVVQTGISGKYLPNESGLAKLHSDIDGINREIAGIIDSAGPTGSVSMDAVLRRVDDLGDFYKYAPNATSYMDDLQAIKGMVTQYHGNVVPTATAQKIKQTIYALHRKHYGEMKTLQIEADKSIARGIKEELVAQYPELGRLNAQDSALISLNTILSRSVNRIRNYDIIRMGDIIGATAGGSAAGIPGASIGYVVKRALDSPQVKSRLAFALKRASQATIGPLYRPAAYGVLESVEEEE